MGTQACLRCRPFPPLHVFRSCSPQPSGYHGHCPATSPVVPSHFSSYVKASPASTPHNQLLDCPACARLSDSSDFSLSAKLLPCFLACLTFICLLRLRRTRLQEPFPDLLVGVGVSARCHARTLGCHHHGTHMLDCQCSFTWTSCKAEQWRPGGLCPVHSSQMR